MRLLRIKEPIKDSELCDVGKVDYAVLSHQWEEGEYQFADLKSHKPMSKKIYEFCRISKERGFEYCWTDTCCIDKSSPSEDNEAIDSMYSWFKNAKFCCVYLSDVEESKNNFAKAKWFTRSWTLLELLAPEPKATFFFDCNWTLLGSKQELSGTISKVTGIPVDVLLHKRVPIEATIGEKLSWASTRDALDKEEVIYALISLLGLRMAMRRGEGQAVAAMRMKEHILENLEDYTVLMWRKPMGLACEHGVAIESDGKAPERAMEQPTWDQIHLHSPIDLISNKDLNGYIPGLSKPPASPQLSGRGLRVTLLAKCVRSYMIAWTYCTQKRNGKLYAVCIRVVRLGAAVNKYDGYIRGATSGLVCYVSVDRLRSFQFTDIYFDISPEV